MPWDNEKRKRQGHKLPLSQVARIIKRDRERGCWFQYPGKCIGTGPKAQVQIHHVIEVEDGGTDDDENLVLACAPCHVHYSAQQSQKRAVAAAWDFKRKPEKHPGVLD